MAGRCCPARCGRPRVPSSRSALSESVNATAAPERHPSSATRCRTLAGWACPSPACWCRPSRVPTNTRTIPCFVAASSQPSGSWTGVAASSGGEVRPFQGDAAGSFEADSPSVDRQQRDLLGVGGQRQSAGTNRLEQSVGAELTAGGLVRRLAFQVQRGEAPAALGPDCGLGMEFCRLRHPRHLRVGNPDTNATDRQRGAMSGLSAVGQCPRAPIRRGVRWVVEGGRDARPATIHDEPPAGAQGCRCAGRCGGGGRARLESVVRRPARRPSPGRRGPRVGRTCRLGGLGWTRQGRHSVDRPAEVRSGRRGGFPARRGAGVRPALAGGGAGLSAAGAGVARDRQRQGRRPADRGQLLPADRHGDRVPRTGGSPGHDVRHHRAGWSTPTC